MLTVESFNTLYHKDEMSIRMIGEKYELDYMGMRRFIYRNKEQIKLRSRPESIRVCFKHKRRDMNGSKNPNYVNGKQIEDGKGKRWSKYGLTKSDFDNLFSKQDGRCAICKDKFTTTPNIDHCHNSLKVRGLLCGSCNKALGYFKDNIEVLNKAIEYLRRW